jgi:nucleotide-binding universal stress UspA family protein
MYTHLLLPTDGSPLSGDALERGLALARSLGAQATILTVVEPFYMFTASDDHLGETREQYEKFAREAARGILQTAKDRAAELGVQAQVKLVGSDHPDQAIIDAVEESGCDLVAMASHGHRGVNALLLGSVTQEVLTRSTVPVLVFRPAA